VKGRATICVAACCPFQRSVNLVNRDPDQHCPLAQPEKEQGVRPSFFLEFFLLTGFVFHSQRSGEMATAQQPLADTYINEASKLNGENYVNWKFKLQTVLELFGGWTIVNGTEQKPTDPALLADWNKREARAKVTLRMSVQDKIIPHIRNCDTSKKTWDTLKSLYETTDANRVLFLKTKLMSIKMEANEGVSKFISRIKDLSDNLAAIGEEVDSTDQVTIALKGLLPDYRVFISALAAREKPPNFVDLTGILLQEEERMKNYDQDAKSSDLALMARGKYMHRGKPWGRPWNGDRGSSWNRDRGKQWNGDRGRSWNEDRGRFH